MQCAKFYRITFSTCSYSTATPKGMPAEFEKYHESDDHVIINVPPNFMFKAKIFKPSRLCDLSKRGIENLDDYWNWHLLSLEYIPYIDASGQLSSSFNLKLVCTPFWSESAAICGLFPRCWSQPQAAPRANLKSATGSNANYRPPSRTIREHRDAWTAENGSIPVGNGSEAKWTQPIDAKVAMTADEQTNYKSSDELTQSKLLKIVARRVEAQILVELESRGVQVQIRFNPKLKKGLTRLEVANQP